MGHSMTPGEQAYEEDVARQPRYWPCVDGTRLPRRPWAELGAIERWSWEKNPTPRNWQNEMCSMSWGLT